MGPHENNLSQNDANKPCRSCMDFKTWTKTTRKAITNDSKPKDGASTSTSSGTNESDIAEYNPDRKDCPLDSVSLGQKSWGLLHTIAAAYPETPSQTQKEDINTFFSTLSRLYPCDHCAKGLVKDLQDEPPVVDSQGTLSQWLCRLHNKVNVKLNKPLFDCTKVNERWRDGWLNGSCD